MPQAESNSLTVWPSFIQQSAQEHTGNRKHVCHVLTPPTLHGSEPRFSDKGRQLRESSSPYIVNKPQARVTVKQNFYIRC